MKIILIIIAIVYTVSPVDFLPGPVDDAVLDLAVVAIIAFMNMAGDLLREKGINVKDEQLDAVSAAATQTLKVRNQEKKKSASAPSATVGKTSDMHMNTDEKVNNLEGF